MIVHHRDLLDRGRGTGTGEKRWVGIECKIPRIVLSNTYGVGCFSLRQVRQFGR